MIKISNNSFFLVVLLKNNSSIAVKNNDSNLEKYKDEIQIKFVQNATGKTIELDWENNICNSEYFTHLEFKPTLKSEFDGHSRVIRFYCA